MHPEARERPVGGPAPRRDDGPDEGVHGLQRILEARVAPIEAPSMPEAVPAATIGMPPPNRPFVRRAGKALIGVGVLAVFGVAPLRTLMQTSSVEAVVNARVVTLRAPIDGEVRAAPEDLASVQVLSRGAPLLHVVNPRVDRGRLVDLRRQLGRVGDDRVALAAKLAFAEAATADLARQAEGFRLGRIEQLEARSAELVSLIAVAAARREEALAAQERASALARTGSVSIAELSRLTREATATAQTEVATRHRLTSAAVELKAARTGLYLGDSYNDRPSSVQRGDEMRQRVADLAADHARLSAEQARLRADVTEETARDAAMSDAAMTLPVASRIWEVLVSPGEQVRAGQDLVRLVDCSATLVTANVTEAAYNRLVVGRPVRFLPADGGAALEGRVVNLTGVADAAANLAIAPGALGREPYRVTVAVPTRGADGSCGVGRTGRVVFDDPQ